MSSLQQCAESLGWTLVQRESHELFGPSPGNAATQASSSAVSNAQDSLATVNRPRSSAKEQLKALQPSGCAVLGVSQPSDRLAHMVRPVRGSSPDQRILKHRVESFLRELGSVEGAFKLDHLSNLLFLSSNLHYMLDTYGLFALCPSLEHLDMLIVEFERANTRWAARPALGRTVNRALDAFELPVLTFCPLGPTIICPHDNFFVYVDNEVAHSCSVVNGEIVNTTTGYPLPHRSQARNTPLFEQRLSPLLCTINAYHKFTRFSDLYPDLYPQLPERIRTLSDRVRKLYGLMMWKPDSYFFTADVTVIAPPFPADLSLASPSTRRQRDTAMSVPASSSSHRRQLEAGDEYSDSESEDSWDSEETGTSLAASEVNAALANLGSSNQDERVAAFAALMQQTSITDLDREWMLQRQRPGAESG